MGIICPMSQKKYKSIDHANHNWALCNKVHELGGFPDWAITSAFYACLHYLRHKIFPFKNGQNINIRNFERYCASIGVIGQKHTVFKNLVKDKCPRNIARNYVRLLDLSYTARYNQYQMGDKTAQDAVYWLQEIKEYATIEG